MTIEQLRDRLNEFLALRPEHKDAPVKMRYEDSVFADVEDTYTRYYGHRSSTIDIADSRVIEFILDEAKR